MNDYTHATRTDDIAKNREWRTNQGFSDPVPSVPPQQTGANPADFDIDWLAINREASSI